MKKKRTILAILIVAIIIIVLCLVKHYCDNQSIKSFAAIGCSVQELSTSNKDSSLKIILDDDKNTAKTIALDDDIVEKVRETDVKDIIGVNVVSDIPKKLLEEKHISIKSIFNPMQLLAASDEYDKYFEDGEDGKMIVIKETPQNIKTELKKINKQHKKLYAEDIFIFKE